MRGIDVFLEKLKAFTEATERLPQEIVPFLVSAVQENIDTTEEPPNAPLTRKLKGSSKPLRDTGSLRASITYRIKDRKVIVGTNLPYAPIQHEGGEIKPEKAKKLAIPATKKVRKWAEVKGVKGFLKMLESRGWRIVFRPKAIIGYPPKTDRTRYGEKLKSGGQLLFIRKSEVKIPARPFMRLEKHQIQEIREIIKEALLEALR